MAKLTDSFWTDANEKTAEEHQADALFIMSGSVLPSQSDAAYIRKVAAELSGRPTSLVMASRSQPRTTKRIRRTIRGSPRTIRTTKKMIRVMAKPRKVFARIAASPTSCASAVIRKRARIRSSASRRK